jgi:hypothetical protein
MMTLKPTDMMEIQTAIDEYERRFPRRPAPSAEVALAWRLGRRGMSKASPLKKDPDSVANAMEQPDETLAEQECNRLMWAWDRIKLQLNISHVFRFDSGLNPTFAGDSQPWVRGVLRFGWWGMVAVVTASVFCFGAIIGGLK